jgi:hypothetical protein
MAKEKKTQISRREFLRDAGLIAGGAALASTALAAACAKPAETITTTVTATPQSVKLALANPIGAQPITVLFPKRLPTLEGKTIAFLAGDANNKWQVDRTNALIQETLAKMYPTAKFLPANTFTMGTGIANDTVVKAVKDKGADCVIIGNAG